MIAHRLVRPHMLDREARLGGPVGHACARQNTDSLDQPQVFHFPESRGAFLEAEDLDDAGDAAEGESAVTAVGVFYAPGVRVSE